MMLDKYMLNETENSLLCLGHDARVKNIQIMFNQELSSKNSKCLPNELDVLGQISAIDKNTKEAKGKLCFPCYVRSKTSEYLVRYSYFQQREIEKMVDELLQQGFAPQLAPMHRLSSWSRRRTGAGGSVSTIELSIHKL